MLDQKDLASVRLTCQTYKAQSTLLVTSLRKQGLHHRSLSTFLPRFPGVRQLETDFFSERLAKQLTGLQSLTVKIGWKGQALAAFTTLSNLTHLCLHGYLKGKPGGVQLTSVRSLLVHTVESVSFGGNLAALPRLTSLSICYTGHWDLTVLSNCSHLTALHLGSTHQVFAVTSLKSLACLSLRAHMTPDSIYLLNFLSRLNSLQELHWQQNCGSWRNDKMGPEHALCLPHLTCLMLSGMKWVITNLHDALTGLTSLQALGISVDCGREDGLSPFSRLSEAFALQAFKAVSAHPPEILQAGKNLASVSRVPEAWGQEWPAQLWHSHPPHYSLPAQCRCIAKPQVSTGLMSN